MNNYIDSDCNYYLSLDKANPNQMDEIRICFSQMEDYIFKLETKYEEETLELQNKIEQIEENNIFDEDKPNSVFIIIVFIIVIIGALSLTKK